MLIFPDCSTVIRHTLSLVTDAPRLVVGTLSIVVGTSRCSQPFVCTLQACQQHSQLLRRALDSNCLGPINCRIWPLLDSGLTTLKSSQRQRFTLRMLVAHMMWWHDLQYFWGQSFTDGLSCSTIRSSCTLHQSSSLSVWEGHYEQHFHFIRQMEVNITQNNDLQKHSNQPWLCSAVVNRWRSFFMKSEGW